MKRILFLILVTYSVTANAQIDKFKNVNVTGWWKLKGDSIVNVSKDSMSTYGSNNKLITERAAKAYARSVGGGITAALPLDLTSNVLSMPPADASNDGCAPAVSVSRWDSADQWRINAGTIYPKLTTTNVNIGGTGTTGFKLNVLGTANITNTLSVIGAITSDADASFNSTKIGRGANNVVGNIVIGENAFPGGAAINQSVIIGYNAQNAAIVSGYGLTTIGYQARRLSTSGFDNVSIGSFSMWSTTGDAGGNTAIGKLSLRNVTGGTNTGIGRHVGQGLTSGSNNLLLGANTDVINGTLNDQISIANRLYRNSTGKWGFETSTGLDCGFNFNGSMKITDTVRTPNIILKSLDTTNLKLVVVDASGNHFKTNWIIPITTGSSTQSGTGGITVFNIAHGLSGIPTYFNVQAASNDADGTTIKYVTADGTNIIIHYSTSPISGIDNLTWKWAAKL